MKKDVCRTLLIPLGQSSKVLDSYEKSSISIKMSWVRMKHRGEYQKILTFEIHKFFVILFNIGTYERSLAASRRPSSSSYSANVFCGHLAAEKTASKKCRLPDLRAKKRKKNVTEKKRLKLVVGRQTHFLLLTLNLTSIFTF